MRVAILINPRAGVPRPDAAAQRETIARDVLRTVGGDGQIIISKGPGHARDVTASLVDTGVDAMVVWGGDGTINEVASQLVYRDIPLGIVPAGSGNGLARELGLEWNERRALETALHGSIRKIDAGELGGRFFFNVAGVGLDARLAEVFNARKRRGIRGYVGSLLSELRRYEPRRYTIRIDGLSVEKKALIVALANTRQYGNRAIIAPLAKPDDGLLDLVVVPPLSPLSTLWHARRLITGTVHGLSDALMHTVREGEITADGSLTFHVDGEVVAGTSVLSIKIHPRALSVRVPVGSAASRH